MAALETKPISQLHTNVKDALKKELGISYQDKDYMASTLNMRKLYEKSQTVIRDVVFEIFAENITPLPPQTIG